MKTLIIGGGEIGNSLYEILAKEYECDLYDSKHGVGPLKVFKENNYDIIHICFPYNEHFVQAVKDYQMMFNPLYTVIHSTVPMGTSEELHAVHSPCMGIHPHLADSMLTFTKFLSGEDAGAVSDYFRRAGMTVYITDEQKTTELMKVLSTTFYGVCIEYTKEVKRLCKEQGVPFEFWTLWTNNYNQGYKRLNHPEYARPNLVPNLARIGGHCILPNKDFIDNKFTKLLRETNDD